MRSTFREHVAALSLASLSLGGVAAAEVSAARSDDAQVSSLWDPEAVREQAARIDTVPLPAFPALPIAVPASEEVRQVPVPSTPVSVSQQVNETDEMVDLSAKGINSSLKGFIKQNLFGALFGTAILAYGGIQGLLRIFPNKIHLDTFALGRLGQADGGDPSATRFQAHSIKVDSRSALVQGGLPAKFHWVMAMLKARYHDYWPTMCFSSSKLLHGLLRAGPHEIVTRPIRSWASSSFPETLIENAVRAADDRYRAVSTKDPRGSHQPLTYAFLVCTYERVFDVQPRACLIPQKDVVSFLMNIPELYRAAQNTGVESMNWLVRVLEICGAIALRYPAALEHECLGDHLEEARRVAKEIYRMYALKPAESEQFLARYVAGYRDHLEPSAQEVAAMRKLWYGTRNPELQAEREQAELTMRTFAEYDRVCREHEIPSWISLLSLPGSLE